MRKYLVLSSAGKPVYASYVLSFALSEPSEPDAPSCAAPSQTPGRPPAQHDRRCHPDARLHLPRCRQLGQAAVRLSLLGRDSSDWRCNTDLLLAARGLPQYDQAGRDQHHLPPQAAAVLRLRVDRRRARVGGASRHLEFPSYCENTLLTSPSSCRPTGQDPSRIPAPRHSLGRSLSPTAEDLQGAYEFRPPTASRWYVYSHVAYDDFLQRADHPERLCRNRQLLSHPARLASDRLQLSHSQSHTSTDVFSRPTLSWALFVVELLQLGTSGPTLEACAHTH